jgi:hypothetical protein
MDPKLAADCQDLREEIRAVADRIGVRASVDKRLAAIGDNIPALKDALTKIEAAASKKAAAEAQYA